MFTMYNMETESPHSNKRKQDAVGFSTVHEVFPSGELNSKKQRLSYEQQSMNGEHMQHGAGNNSPNTNGFAQMNGHLLANHAGTNGSYSQETNATGEMVDGVITVSEAMECSDQPNGQTKTEVNGNLTRTALGKFCPHGHLNTCTKYNVPCRYPRMYCHPGGLLEDRLATYHGF